ncbi:MAG: HypC/HybG/HupF family hydrogenase formation chaperone [Patescibacteria group bacterium]|jgi:hydrogenase assembly chaperone HypC/HupF
MCFGIPCKIEKIKKNKATVKNGGKVFNIDTSLLPEAAKGDWILVQGNIGMKKVSEREAKECLAVFSELEKSRGREE